ncbi:hypothetical protein DSM104443_01743 [Usitatibacter rugosus]|uniref:YfiR family protein n=1 Tax=Usitatibacter rugosus TaxID=2732067 RepID=A0A6M4GU62_9PROT|nr:YfiR family protein [Usitatibacter rugosus]QJR10676.1 hypothetical protein DSM104443_01743 [Usitatibacter rugosus]
MVEPRHSTGRRAALAALSCLVLAGTGLCHPLPARADDAATAERRIKAAYLYKFAGYVEWPESSFEKPESPVVIAVLDADALAADLAEVVAGRQLGTRPIEVRRVREGEPLPRAHVLFASRSAAAAAIRGSARQPTLVVTDSKGALAQGSVINFAVTDGKVRFEVSMDSAEQRGIKLSSRLLAAATNLRAGAN